MDVGSMVNQGLIGMQRSQAEMAGSAQQIARASATSSPQSTETAQVSGTMDIVEPLLNIQAQQQVFDSSARVVAAADENLGRLIDTSV